MSYLASPIPGPIKISPGVKYFYVIAQQGYSSITVDPNPNFDLQLDFGSPATLKLTYTGPTHAFDAFEQITFHANDSTGSISQTLLFSVFATGSPIIPSITNVAGQSVAPGATINMAVTSDIPAIYSVENLPGTLSYNATTKRITGTASAFNGFFIITLVATNPTWPPAVYKRYFVLTVGTGGGSSDITIGWATPPDLRRCLFDGDFTVAQLAGPPQFEIPFKVDPKPYAYKLPYWQFLSNYVDIPFGTAGPIGGTYVGGSPGTFKSIGGGIIEFWREYAVIPDTRSEYESFVYSYQIVLIGSGGGITEMPITVQSRLQYDYFQTDDPETEIDLPKAPRAFQVLNVIYLLNGWLSAFLAPSGNEILAEDATYKQWKGNIYERKQRLVRSISLNDIFASAL